MIRTMRALGLKGAAQKPGMALAEHNARLAALSSQHDDDDEDAA